MSILIKFAYFFLIVVLNCAIVAIITCICEDTINDILFSLTGNSYMVDDIRKLLFIIATASLIIAINLTLIALIFT